MKKCSTCGDLYSGDLCPKCMAGFAQNPTNPTQPPEDLPLKPGQTFHGMEILELLGRGGMGVVFKARQPALDRMVALKILPQKMALDPDFQNRFIREAKALGSLSHPNIVAVYDFGAEAGLFFFAMEFVDGTNLRQILRDRKLTPEQALKLVPQLCDALEYAHEEGVVHRDIKPENILLDRKGRVKIADFGLAKLIGADVAAQGKLTMTNMVMGTPHYMAPEQVENPKSVDHRADIYSIGVVFYEMLTGELPIGRFEVPSKKVQIDVRLDEVVLKALEKAPERRYQKASDVKDAVTRATAVVGATDAYSPTVVTPVPARKRPNRPLLAMAAVTALAVIVALVALLNRPRPVAPVTPTVEAPKPPEPFDFTRLIFTQEESPVALRLVDPGGLLVRSPLYAKDPADIERVVNWLGYPSLTPGDVKQAFLAVWFWRQLIFVALETSAAERLEREVAQDKKMWNRWSYRKGPLLVLALAQERRHRNLLVEAVGLARKRLGLPEEPLDTPLENLRFDKSETPKEWVITKEDRTPTGFRIDLGKAEGERLISFAARQMPDLESAKRLETDWPRDPDSQPALRNEVIRTGRTVTLVSLRSKEVYTYETIAEKVREWMGVPKRTWGTILPLAAELPDGYSFEKIEQDPAAILKELALEDVPPADVKRAWRARMKPAGSMLLLEIKDFQVRSRAEYQLAKRGAAEDEDVWIFAVEAPDDPGLDALENFMRARTGNSPNRPRYIKVKHARLEEKDLPAGYVIARTGAPSDTQDQGDLDGPKGKISYGMKDYSDMKFLWADLKTLRKKPDDIVIEKDFMLVHLSGPESAWGVMDELEATLRRKMRMGPPTVEEYAIAAAELPKDTAYLDGSGVSRSNPAVLKPSSKEMAGWWQGTVSPSGTRIDLFQVADPAKVAAVAGGLQEDKNAQQFFGKLAKGLFVATLVQNGRRDEAAFNALRELVRVKLRVPR